MSVIINDPYLCLIWSAIVREMELASLSHPHYPADDLRRTALVVEEAGEALKEALNLTRPGADNSYFRPRLRDELLQTAAMAIHQLSVMLEEESRGR